ncbi:DUF6233 domain-containing protein [Streptomyces sp. NPDC053048]|uniref:DUF6233 domain-containing protein n=1 Tax=Streptomyces sp. NPDC053048 TaxID=3365694 RepID=UPI0037D2DEBE
MTTPLPPDLSRLQTLELYLDLQLQAVRDRIAALTPATLSTPATSWRLQHIRGAPGHLAVLHTEHCHIIARAQPSLPRLGEREARLALDEPGVEPCGGCTPERTLRDARGTPR